MYNTNNPVEPNGSSDPRDLGDNAQVLDLLLNGDSPVVTGRTGKQLKGIATLQNIITSLDLGSFTFSDTASGLGGTTDGQYFRVPQGEASEVSFIYYRNNNGIAEIVAKTQGVIFQGQKFADYLEYAKSGYLSGVLSSDYYLIYGVDINGDFQSNSDVFSDLGINVESLKTIVESYKPTTNKEYEKSGYQSALLSADSLLLAGEDAHGRAVTQQGIIIAKETEYKKSGLPYALISSDFFLITSVINQNNLFYIKKVGDVDCLFMKAVLGKEKQITYQYNVSDIKEIAGRVVFTWDNSDRAALSNLYFCNQDGSGPYPYVPRTDAIALFGHSFIDNNRMSAKLQNLSGLPCYPIGRSGATSLCLAYRYGAYPVKYYSATGNLPADGSASALFPSMGTMMAVSADGAAYEQTRVNIKDRECVAIWSAKAMRAFVRDSGQAVQMDALTKMVFSPTVRANVSDVNTGEVLTAGGTYFHSMKACVTVIWTGRNSMPNWKAALKDLDAIIVEAKKSSINPRLVVMPEFMYNTETPGTDNYLAVMNYNREAKRKYPEYYCEIEGVDALANFIAHYNPNYPDDVADVKAGITPRSLRYDGLHPSQEQRDNALYAGADVNAEFILKFIKNKGWL